MGKSLKHRPELYRARARIRTSKLLQEQSEILGETYLHLLVKGSYDFCFAPPKMGKSLKHRPVFQ